jgi:hypothetical protein
VKLSMSFIIKREAFFENIFFSAFGELIIQLVKFYHGFDMKDKKLSASAAK